MSELIVEMRTDVRYCDAHARGRIRQWKIQLAKDYKIFEQAFFRFRENEYKLLRPLAFDMLRSFRAGRRRAFEKLNRALGPAVRLESVQLDKGNVLALWSVLKPRGPVMLESDGQDCVSVDYVVLSASDKTDVLLLGDGLWTLAVPDHALGRAIAGSHLLHPGEVIRDAHACILHLPNTVLKRSDFSNQNLPGACIKAGAGCFIGHFMRARDTSNNDRPSAFVQVWTWIDKHQLHEDQTLLCAQGEPGKTLGDTWLKPNPLCDFNQIWVNEIIDAGQKIYGLGGRQCPQILKSSPER